MQKEQFVILVLPGRCKYKLVKLFAILIFMTACTSDPLHNGEVYNLSDPMIGKIYKAHGPRAIAREALLEVMTNSDVIYLGETHDNIYQHQIQLDIIKALVDRGWVPAIGFEFFSQEQTSHLSTYMVSTNSSHTGLSQHSPDQLLRIKLGWGSNRDKDWQHLLPILQYAKEHGLPVFGADLSDGQRKRLAKAGYDALTPVEKLLVPLTDFNDDGYREMMYRSYKESHCGWGDAAYMARLYETWLARNEAMAGAIIAMHSDRPQQPVVVILGAGHTQYNMAVYERTAHLLNGIKQVNLRLLQVGKAPLEAVEYFEPLKINDTNFGVPYEYIWFTQRIAERPDPCAVFNQRKKRQSP